MIRRFIRIRKIAEPLQAHPGKIIISSPVIEEILVPSAYRGELARDGKNPLAGLVVVLIEGQLVYRAAVVIQSYFHRKVAGEQIM